MRPQITGYLAVLLTLSLLHPFTALALNQEPTPKPKVVKEKPKPPPKKEEPRKKEDPPELSETQERLITTLYQSAFSKNETIRYYAYMMFDRDPELMEHLGHEIQLELIEAAFKEKHPESSILSYAFGILEQSSLPAARRHTILLKSLKSENESLQKLSLDALTLDKKIVLKRLTAEMRADLTGQHDTAFQLIEHWGSDAAAAVPVLIERYEALKTKAIKKNPKTSSPKFDYLSIVYALAEIGPAANDAISIAIAATNEKAKENRAEYPLAGIICIEKLTSAGSIVEAERKTDLLPVRARLSRLDPGVVEKYRKYAESLMKTYDKDGDEMLSQGENSVMRRPIEANADINRDGLISADELLYSFASIPASRSSTVSRSRSSRTKRKKRNMVRDQVEGLLNEKLRIEQNKQKAPAASKR